MRDDCKWQWHKAVVRTASDSCASGTPAAMADTVGITDCLRLIAS